MMTSREIPFSSLKILFLLYTGTMAGNHCSGAAIFTGGSPGVTKAGRQTNNGYAFS
jgi:hypothetical protein